MFYVFKDINFKRRKSVAKGEGAPKSMTAGLGCGPGCTPSVTTAPLRRHMR